MLQAGLAALVLLRLHPRPLAHTPSFEFSTSFMGAMCGVILGIAWVAPFGQQPPVQVSSRSLGSVLCCAMAKARAQWGGAQLHPLPLPHSS